MQFLSLGISRRIAAILTYLIVSCQNLPVERPVATTSFDLPSTFASATNAQNSRIATGWLKSFQDPALTSIVLQALSNNPNLQSTAANLKSVREGTIIARSALLPNLSASGRSSANFFNGDHSENYGLSLNASWEPDLWKRLRDLEAASFADYKAAVADFRSARLSLAANTAKAYLNLITSQQQLTLAEQNLASLEKVGAIIERGVKAGTLRAIDANLSRNNIASAKRSLAARQLSRNEASRSLNLLLGSYPDHSFTARQDLPSPHQLQIPAGLPSSLLERRPDLAARRANLFASALRADATRKNLLPNFALTGSSGISSSQLKTLLDPSELATSIASSITQTLLDGGRRAAQTRSALANHEAQLKLYTRDTLQALSEVESALDSARSLADQEIFLIEEVKQADLAEKQANDAAIIGIDTGGFNILEVLEAQRRALSSHAALIALRNQRLQNHLDLLLALGGSF